MLANSPFEECRTDCSRMINNWKEGPREELFSNSFLGPIKPTAAYLPPTSLPLILALIFNSIQFNLKFNLHNSKIATEILNRLIIPPNIPFFDAALYGDSRTARESPDRADIIWSVTDHNVPFIAALHPPQFHNFTSGE